VKNLPSGSQCLVVYSGGGTRDPLAVLSTLLAALQRAGNRVTVLDISAGDSVTLGYPSRWASRLLSVPKSSAHLQSIVHNYGARHVSLPTGPGEPREPLRGQEHQELAESARSTTLSYFRDDTLRGSRYERKLYRASLEGAEVTFSGLLRFLGDHPEFDTVVVPNGRAAKQRACILAASRAKRDLLFYEIGRASQKAAYIGRHRMHDREGTQGAARDYASALSEVETLSLAHDWLGERTRPESELNQFSRTWNSRKRRIEAETSEGSELAVFFSSSADEFTALGPEWDLQEWRDQYEAFGSILEHFEGRGIGCVLRVHPNLVNKSPRHFWSEVAKIRRLSKGHPNLEIIWPHQPLDSYVLVRKADYVVVARSTIGLEASLMGKCVWATTPTRYDLLGDVRQIWTKTAVTKKNLSLWSANPLGAAQWVSHLVTSDFPFSDEARQLAPWNSASPPWNVRLANFLAARPLRHKIHLVSLELARMVHSRVPLWFLARR
jgi:hypothetical protein